MRPCFRPDVAVTWYQVDTVHVVRGKRLQVLSGLPVGSATLLRQLDGTHELNDVVRLTSRATGLSADDCLQVVNQLTELDALYDAGALPRLTDLSEVARDRLRAEALSWIRTTNPAAVLERRRASHVRLLSHDPATVATALILAASGVGNFAITARGADVDVVTTADVIPGGLPARTVGTPRVTAIRQALAELGAETRPQKYRPHPDFALIGSDGVTSIGYPGTLDVPHLATRVAGRYAAVGPLVIPGVTACLTCDALARENQPPSSLPALAAFEAVHEPLAAAAAVFQLAAGHAAVAALEFLDNTQHQQVPALAGHALHIEVPGPRIEITRVPPHPQCGCCWAAA